MGSSTDVRLRMGEEATTLDQEEQHSTLPGEQHGYEGANNIEIGEPNLGREEEQSYGAGRGEDIPS